MRWALYNRPICWPTRTKEMEIKMEEIKVVLDWFANTNHTGFLLAQKRGYFAEAGLEV